MNRELLREFLIDFFRLIVLYFVFRMFWGSETWFHDQVKELLFGIVTTLLFLVLSIIKQPFARPVKLSITQKNAQYNRPETTFSIKGRKMTQEHERVVSVEIVVKRRFSVIGTIALWLIRKHDLVVGVQSATSGIILQAEHEQVRNDMESTNRGFNIKIGQYIVDILQGSNNGDFKKGCRYVVNPDTNFRVTEEVFQIHPILVSNTRFSSLWVALLLQFHCEDHTVHFIHE